MMSVIDMNIDKYLDVLKSNSPAPGGGAVAAFSLAQGLCLLMMVANFTIGKEKYRQWEAHCIEVKEECERLLKRAKELIDEDAESYSAVVKAYGLPADTEKEKAKKNLEIQNKTRRATEVPLEVVELSKKGLMLAEKLNGKSNPNIVSDIAVAVNNFENSSKSAWVNVRINLPNIEDCHFKGEIEKNGEDDVKYIEEQSKRLYESILKQL